IPVLIIFFLVVIAAARFLSLMTVREDIEQNARTVLALAASELAGSISLSTPAIGLDAETASLAVEKTIRRGSLRNDAIFLVTDPDFRVLAASPSGHDLIGRDLDGLIAGGQPLFMFGDRAGVMEVLI